MKPAATLQKNSLAISVTQTGIRIDVSTNTPSINLVGTKSLTETWDSGLRWDTGLMWDEGATLYPPSIQLAPQRITIDVL